MKARTLSNSSRRVIAGIGTLLVAGVMGGLVVADRFLPGPSHAPGWGKPVVLEPAPLILSCPPPAVSGKAQLLAAMPVTQARSTAIFESFAGGSHPFANQDTTAGGYVSIPAELDGQPLSASVIQTVSKGEKRSLTAASCSALSNDIYLVGGDTKLGDSSELVIVNPADRGTNVKVDLWGETGPIDYPRGKSVAVEPHGVTVLPLEAGAADYARIVARITSEDLAITAYMRVHKTNGLAPAGTDWVQSSYPSKHLFIPGIELTNPGGQLRLLNLEDKALTATINLVSEKGIQPLAGADKITLDPGAVFDISLSGIEKGFYGIEVKGAGRMVGGAVVERSGAGVADDPKQKMSEFAWIPAQIPGISGMFMQPRKIDTKLVVMNPTDSPQTLNIGETRQEIPAGRTVAIGFPKTEKAQRDRAVAVSGENLVAAQVFRAKLAGGDGTAVTPLQSAVAARQRIYVQLLN